MSEYKTISKTSTGEYKEKGSKFIAHVFPVDDVHQVKSILDELWNNNKGACHVCYAYKIGLSTNEVYRINDDGEPSGSAGKPIYGQILSNEITNCLIAVVRFYGGTKLGVGGLITAYKEASKEALRNNEFVKKKITAKIVIQFGYELTAEVNRIINQNSLQVASQKFDYDCVWKVLVPKDEVEEIEKSFFNIEGVTLKANT